MDSNDADTARVGDRVTLARLDRKVCIVAGAAGVIGSAAANRLESEGGIVVGIDQEPHSTGALSLHADLSVEAEAEAIFAEIHQKLGRIDVLVNNVGLNHPDDHSVLDMSWTPGTECLRSISRQRSCHASTPFLTC